MGDPEAKMVQNVVHRARGLGVFHESAHRKGLGKLARFGS